MTSIFLCARCRAILGNNLQQDEHGTFVCHTCRARFIPDGSCDYCRAQPVGRRPCLEVEAFLREWWSVADFPDPARHHADLVEIAGLAIGEGDRSGTVLTGLFRSLATAKGFVHFTSWGISYLMLGALKLLSEQNVLVNGIVSAVRYSEMLDEMNGHVAADESLFMNVVGLSREQSDGAPHQKLIVIDGMIAFKGSANLTTAGWRKASEQREIVEVVTRPADVARLHNIYFSKAWLQWGHNRFMRADDIIKMQHQ